MPGILWLRSFMGLPGTAGSGLTTVPYPRSEMAVNVTFKTVRSGTIMGVGVLGPLIALKKQHMTWTSVSQHAFRFGRYGALFGLAIGPMLSYIATIPMPLDEIQGQCLKHRRTAQHNRVDRSSLVGAIVGSAYTRITIGAAAPGAIFGLCLGVTLGEIYHIFRDSPRISEAQHCINPLKHE